MARVNNLELIPLQKINKLINSILRTIYFVQAKPIQSDGTPIQWAAQSSHMMLTRKRWKQQEE